MTIWCRVRSLRTGHHYDVPIERLDALAAAGRVEEIPGRRIRATNPRPAKPHRRLGRLTKHKEMT